MPKPTAEELVELHASIEHAREALGTPQQRAYLPRPGSHRVGPGGSLGSRPTPYGESPWAPRIRDAKREAGSLAGGGGFGVARSETARARSRASGPAEGPPLRSERARGHGARRR